MQACTLLHLLAMLGANSLSLLIILGIFQPFTKPLALLVRHQLLPEERLRQIDSSFPRTLQHPLLMLGPKAYPLSDVLHLLDAIAILAALFATHQLRAVDVAIPKLLPILDMQLLAQLLAILDTIRIAVLSTGLVSILNPVLVAVLDLVAFLPPVLDPVSTRDPILDPVLVGDSVLIAVLNAIPIGRTVLIGDGVAYSVPISVLRVHGNRCESRRDQGRPSRTSCGSPHCRSPIRLQLSMFSL